MHQWVVILTHQHKGSCRDFCADGAVYSSTMNKPSQLSTDVSTAEIAYICLDSVEMSFFKENWAVIPHPFINPKQWANTKVNHKD